VKSNPQSVSFPFRGITPPFGYPLPAIINPRFFPFVTSPVFPLLHKNLLLEEAYRKTCGPLLHLRQMVRRPFSVYSQGHQDRRDTVRWKESLVGCMYLTFPPALCFTLVGFSFLLCVDRPPWGCEHRDFAIFFAPSPTYSSSTLFLGVGLNTFSDMLGCSSPLYLILFFE